MFNCVRPPDSPEQQQQQAELEAAEQQQNGRTADPATAAAATAAPSSSRRPAKLRVRLRLRELAGVTLSHGVLFAKVRLLSGGRFCQFSEHREIRDNKVSWSDQAPMEFACRLGPGSPPAHLRVSVRREERGGRSYTKVGFAVIDISDLPWTGDAEHKCILSPYSLSQRLDNSTISFSLHPLLMHLAAAAAGDAAVTASDSPQQQHQQLLLGAQFTAAPGGIPASTSTAALVSLAGVVGFVPGHRRNPSNFSSCSVRTHSRNNSLEQEAVLTCNSSQSSSVPSFDLMPSSLERRRTGLTPTRELNSRIANTRTDNFQIVKEVLEREGILLCPEAGET